MKRILKSIKKRVRAVFWSNFKEQDRKHWHACFIPKMRIGFIAALPAVQFNFCWLFYGCLITVITQEYDELDTSSL